MKTFGTKPIMIEILVHFTIICSQRGQILFTFKLIKLDRTWSLLTTLWFQSWPPEIRKSLLGYVVNKYISAYSTAHGEFGRDSPTLTLPREKLLVKTAKFLFKKCLLYIDGLVKERCNSSALAMELRLFCIIPSICLNSGQNGRHSTGDIFKRIFFNEMCCRFIPIFRSLFIRQRFQLNKCICSGNGLAPNRRQATIWTNGVPVHWCLYIYIHIHIYTYIQLYVCVYIYIVYFPSIFA